MAIASDVKSGGAPSWPLTAWLHRLDLRLQAVPKPLQWAVLAGTIAAMISQALPWVPRPVIDYSRVAGLRHVQQPQSYGTDTLSDEYEARLILHDPADMYTKTETPQTPLEARAWSKEATAPYPPAVLLVEATLFGLGGRSITGFYCTILGMAVTFFALSLRYFLRTRWYLFPLLYLNFHYLAQRFIEVQDDTYLIMLVVIVLALLAAKRHRALAHELMAVAIILKFSPLYYTTEILRMRRRTAAVFVAILLAGLVLPLFLLRNYLYIYFYETTLKGSGSMHLAALTAVVPFAAVLWYVETRRSFDLEDRIGWGAVPFGLFFALGTNAARHLLLVLLVPDKRAWRNVAAATGLALNAAAPTAIPLGSVLSIVSGFLVVILAGHLCAIGWRTIRDDLRHPLRTAALMAGR